MKLLPCFLVTIFLAAVAVAAADAPPTPGGAVGPLKKYAAAVAEADAVRAKAVDRARVALVSELKAAQKTALERGDVDGATKIAEMVKANSQTAPSERDAVAGVNWQRSLGDRIRLNADGSISVTEGGFGGKWVPVGDKSFVLFWNHGWIDFWKIDASGKSLRSLCYKKESEYGATAVK